MPTTRIYAVTLNDNIRLVRAPNVSQAINHVARDTIKAEVAGQQTLLDCVMKGTEVETAGSAE